MVVMNTTVPPIVQTHASKAQKKYLWFCPIVELMITLLVLHVSCTLSLWIALSLLKMIVHLSREEKGEQYACYQFIQCVTTYYLSESLHGNSKLFVAEIIFIYCIMKINVTRYWLVKCDKEKSRDNDIPAHNWNLKSICLCVCCVSVYLSVCLSVCLTICVLARTSLNWPGWFSLGWTD